jgi:hypothetical protein
MMALFETADGMTKWQLVQDPLPHIVRFAIISPFALMDNYHSDEKIVPPFLHRDYEMIEIRRDRSDKEYVYYREKG